MDEAYRDRTAAAQARADALEGENRALRERVESLERELRLLRTRPSTGSVQHSGRVVVLGLIVGVLAIFGAAAYMFLQMGHRSSPYVIAPAAPAIPAPPSH